MHYFQKQRACASAPVVSLAPNLCGTLSGPHSRASNAQCWPRGSTIVHWGWGGAVPEVGHPGGGAQCHSASANPKLCTAGAPLPRSVAVLIVERHTCGPQPCLLTVGVELREEGDPETDCLIATLPCSACWDVNAAEMPLKMLTVPWEMQTPGIPEIPVQPGDRGGECCHSPRQVRFLSPG